MGEAAAPGSAATERPPPLIHPPTPSPNGAGVLPLARLDAPCSPHSQPRICRVSRALLPLGRSLTPTAPPGPLPHPHASPWAAPSPTPLQVAKQEDYWDSVNLVAGRYVEKPKLEGLKDFAAQVKQEVRP